jgi:hypothetical protein
MKLNKIEKGIVLLGSLLAVASCSAPVEKTRNQIPSSPTLALLEPTKTPSPLPTKTETPTKIPTLPPAIDTPTHEPTATKDASAETAELSSEYIKYGNLSIKFENPELKELLDPTKSVMTQELVNSHIQKALYASATGEYNGSLQTTPFIVNIPKANPKFSPTTNEIIGYTINQKDIGNMTINPNNIVLEINTIKLSNLIDYPMGPYNLAGNIGWDGQRLIVQIGVNEKQLAWFKANKGEQVDNFTYLFQQVLFDLSSGNTQKGFSEKNQGMDWNIPASKIISQELFSIIQKSQNK